MRCQNPKSVWFRASLFATLFVLLFLAPVAHAATGKKVPQGVPLAAVLLSETAEEEKQHIYAALSLGAVVVIFGIVLAADVWKRDAVQRRIETGTRYEKCLADAKQKALETNNFSDAWVKSAAHVGWEAILKDQRETERREAERLIHARNREADYAAIAEYARAWYGLNKVETVEMLRKVDEVPYRLVKHAIEKAEEVAHGA